MRKFVFLLLLILNINMLISIIPVTKADELEWDVLNEHWTSLGNWTRFWKGLTEIDPESQLHQQGAGRIYTIPSGVPNEYTFEVRLKIESFDIYWHFYYVLDGEHLLHIRIKKDMIQCCNVTGGYQEIPLITNEDVFYVFRFVVFSSKDLVQVYRDDIEIGEFTSLFDATFNDGEVRTGAVTACESREDYFFISSSIPKPKKKAGGHTPSPRPPWERVPDFISQLVRNHVTTPFWNMWTQLNVTFEGILATIVIIVSVYLGLECYHRIRRGKKKLKIAKIKFS